MENKEEKELLERYGSPDVPTNGQICAIYKDGVKFGSYVPALWVRKWLHLEDINDDHLRIKIKRIYDKSRALRGSKLSTFHSEQFYVQGWYFLLFFSVSVHVALSFVVFYFLLCSLKSLNSLLSAC